METVQHDAVDLEYLEVALAETFSKPGTADVTPADRAKLAGLLKHYRGKAHPFTACKRDQMKHGLSEEHANRRCAVIKDLIEGNTKWREGGHKTSHLSEEELETFALDADEEFFTWLSETDADEMIREAEEEQEKVGIVRTLSRFLGLSEGADTQEADPDPDPLEEVEEEEIAALAEEEGIPFSEAVELHLRTSRRKGSHNEGSHGTRAGFGADGPKASRGKRGGSGSGGGKGGSRGPLKVHRDDIVEVEIDGKKTRARVTAPGPAGSRIGVVPITRDKEGDAVLVDHDKITKKSKEGYLSQAERETGGKRTSADLTNDVAGAVEEKIDEIETGDQFEETIPGPTATDAKRALRQFREETRRNPTEDGAKNAADSAIRKAKTKYAKAKVREAADFADISYSLGAAVEPAVDLSYQLPYDLTEPEKISRRLWRKHLLPLGKKINYTRNGVRQVLDFSKETLEKMADNFRAGAFDKVYFTTHHPKPGREASESSRGVVRDVFLKEDGLYADIEVSEEGERLLTNSLNEIGTSVSYHQNYRRDADDTVFGPAIQHIAATPTPHVPGLKPWEAVQMSEEELEVVDLTGAEYAAPDPVPRKESGPMETQTNEETREVEMEQEQQQTISLEEFNALKAELEAERSDRQGIRATLRNQGINAMVNQMVAERKIAPPDVEPFKVVLSALSARDNDVIELSDDGAAAVKDDELGKALLQLASISVVPEVGERGATDLESRDDMDEDRKIDLEVQQYRAEHPGVEYPQALEVIMAKREVG